MKRTTRCFFQATASLTPLIFTPLAAAAIDDSAEVSIQIDGGAPIVLQSPVTLNDSGQFEISEVVVDEQGAWELALSFMIESDSQGGVTISSGSIGGQLEFENLSNEAVEVELTLRVPLCTGINGSTDLSGSSNVILVLDENGGMLALDSAQGAAAVSLMSDEQSVASMWHAPFHMSGTGAASMLSSSNLSYQGELTGPAMLSSTGVNYHFNLTDGERVTFDGALHIDPGPDSEPAELCQTGKGAACDADLNGDAVVNAADLILLLGAWGQGGGAADLNGDGAVGGSDLTILLQTWGSIGGSIWP